MIQKGDKTMAKYLDKLNYKLKLIKNLHEPKTKKECINEVFGDESMEDIYYETKNRIIRNYINEGDIKIDNVTIPFNIKTIRETKEIYSDGVLSVDPFNESEIENKSTVHPIILPLNLTEVYMLTNGILDIIGTNHQQYQSYKEIASKIYSQLSPYARKRIIQSIHGLEDYSEVEYTSEYETISNNLMFIIGTAEKFNEDVRVETFDGQSYVGKIHNRNHEIHLQTFDKDIKLCELGIKNIEIL